MGRFLAPKPEDNLMPIPLWASANRQLPVDLIPEKFNAHQKLAAQLAIASLCHFHQISESIGIPIDKLTPRDIVFAIEKEIVQ